MIHNPGYTETSLSAWMRDTKILADRIGMILSRKKSLTSVKWKRELFNCF